MPEPSSSHSSGEYADAISEIIDRDAKARARATAPPPPAKRPLQSGVLVGVLGVVFVVVWVGALRSIRTPPEPLNPQATELNARIKTFAVAERVRQYEEEHGHPPASLAEIGMEDTGLTLIVEGGRWRVEEVVDGEIVDAAADEDPLAVIREMAEPQGAGPGGAP